MIDDAELLRRYAEEKSEPAFAELVQRRIGLVYSVALRHTHDAQRAEDVAQRVFTDLARKAEKLAGRAMLIGWLYRSAQFAASDAVRAESRRQAREQEVHTMHEIERAAREPDWNKLHPVLDEILNAMDDRDRDAVLLRFFDGRPFGEIGAKLRLTENAARMRVERALEKMRVALARRGVTSTSAALSVVLASQAGAAAPAGLAASVASAAVTSGAAAGVIFMNTTKFSLGMIIGALVTIMGTTMLWQQRTNTLKQRELREESTRLRSQVEALLIEAREVANLRRENAYLRQTASTLAPKMQGPNQHVDLSNAGAEGAAPPKGMKNRDAWRNLGRVTPGDTYETIMWASDRGDLDVLVEAFVLNDTQKAEAEAVFKRLPEDDRSKYKTPERMMALLFASGTPAAIQPISETVAGPEDTIVRTRIWNDRRRETTELELPFHRYPDGWRVLVPQWHMNKSLGKLR